MRRIASVLVVAVAVCVAVAATVDAVRTSGSAAPEPPPKTAQRPIHLASFGGRLVWIDGHCRLRSLSLPNLRRNGSAVRVGCGDVLDSDGRATRGQRVWRPDGALVASCRRGTVLVAPAPGTPPVFATAGCHPAWRPDGTLTYVHHGELRMSSRLLDGRVVVGRTAIRRAAGESSRPVRAAWLDDRRVAVVLERGGQSSVAIFLRGRLVGRPVPVRGRVTELTATARGSYVVARASAGLLVVDRDGEQVGLPLADASDLAFSPDERWALAVGPRSTLLFRPGDFQLRFRRLPVRATQIAWTP